MAPSYGRISDDAEADKEELQLDEINVWGNTKAKPSNKLISRAKWSVRTIMNGTGTMPGFQRYVEDKPILLILTAFLRSCSMFYGLSNPIMGICSLAAALTDSPFNFLFLIWSVSWTMIWSFCLKVPRGLILNGLYPSQGILLGYSMYITYDPVDLSNLPNTYCLLGNFATLIPLTLVNIIFFETLSTIMMKRGVPPMMIATMTTSTAWWLATGLSKHFVNKNLYPYLIEPHREPLPFNITLDEYVTEVIYGVSMLQFSNTKLCCVPITIGLFITSPIACFTNWCGSFVGISSAVLLGLDFKYVRLGLWGLNSAICFSVIAGNFFVLSPQSFLLAVIGTFASAYFQMAHVAVSKVFGFPVYAFPATMVILALYVVSDSLHNIYRVPIEMLTIPEDHLRRFRLTKNIFKHIPWFKNMVSDLDTGIQKEIAGVLQSVILEENVLSGKSKGVLKFLRLEADTMGCLVDGKALHLAVVADRDEIVKVLINSGEKLNSTTKYTKSPLVTALKIKNYKTADILKQNGAKLKLSDIEQAQILNCIVAADQNKNLETWIKYGADVNTADEFGRTVKHIAMLNNNIDGYNLLERYGAKDVADKFGRFPKEYVRSVAETYHFQDYSTNPITEPALLQTPPALHPTISEEALSMISRLVSSKNLGEQGKELKDLLLAFLVKNDVKHLQPCFSSSADLQSPLLPLSLLHLAARHSNTPVVQLLCSQGADTNNISRTGRSPLDEALQHGAPSTCKVLISFGAKPYYYSSKLMRLGVLFRNSFYRNDLKRLNNIIECGMLERMVMYDKIKLSDFLTIPGPSEFKEHLQEYLNNTIS